MVSLSQTFNTDPNVDNDLKNKSPLHQIIVYKYEEMRRIEIRANKIEEIFNAK